MYDSNLGAAGSDIEIIKISFADIPLIWQKHLWPRRQSLIEPYSAINMLGEIDASIVDLKPAAHFFAVLLDQNLSAVTSYHQTAAQQYRLRGTWVDEKFRGCGIGKKLISRLIHDNFKSGDTVWTLSREANIPFYEKAGFVRSKTVDGYEYGPHCVMILKR